MRKRITSCFGQPLIEEEEKEEVLDSMAKAWLGTGRGGEVRA